VYVLYNRLFILNRTEITNKMQPCTRIYYSNLFFFISNLIHCFFVYVQYLLSSFLYMFQASQAHHQEV